MPILSDATIQDRMKRNELVLGGAENRAIHCSYEFRAGKIFPGGADGPVFAIDWTGEADGQRYLVKPGELVWIRSREQVSLPKDVCGIWIQTNTLSRKGLLLINCSLVEPGYTGHLSCNFVNFGREPVSLFPDGAIAKLLFVNLDRECKLPFEGKLDNYDRMISEIARQGPSSFLQIADMSTRLDDARKGALSEIEKQANAQLLSARKAIDEAGELARKRELELFASDTKSYLLKGFAWAVLATAMLGVVDCVKEKVVGDSLSRDDVSSMVDRAIANKLSVASCPLPAVSPSGQPDAGVTMLDGRGP